MSFAEVLSGTRAWHVECADVLDGLRQLPDGCVDCVVSSPPYFALRSYLDKDSPLKGREIGSEPTPAAFVATMVAVFAEVRRVLKGTGLAWVNLGDSYCNSGSRNNGTGLDGKRRGGVRDTDGTWEEAKEGYGDIRRAFVDQGIKHQDLMGVPWRVALALQEDGWILRGDCIWYKRSPMPESLSGWRWERCRVKVAPQPKGAGRKAGALGQRDVGSLMEMNGRAQWEDCPGCPKCSPNGGLVLRRGSWRCTKAHEYIFQLAKSSNYYADGEPVRTPLAEATVSRDQYSRLLDDPDEQFAVRHDHETVGNAAGANLRSVWTLKVEPLREPHYAAYPPSLPDRCIRASVSQHGNCGACGMPWARVVEDGEFVPMRWSAGMDKTLRAQDVAFGSSSREFSAMVRGGVVQKVTTGWRPTCSCYGPVVPPVVLDPFAGSGTTLVAARRLGCRALGIDLSPAYAAMARRRVEGDSPLFNGGAADAADA